MESLESPPGDCALARPMKDFGLIRSLRLLQKRRKPRIVDAGLSNEIRVIYLVIPTKVGIHVSLSYSVSCLDSHLRGNDTPL